MAVRRIAVNVAKLPELLAENGRQGSRFVLAHASSASLARVRFTMSDKLPSAHRTRYMPGYFGSAEGTAWLTTQCIANQSPPLDPC